MSKYENLTLCLDSGIVTESIRDIAGRGYDTYQRCKLTPDQLRIVNNIVEGARFDSAALEKKKRIAQLRAQLAELEARP